MRPIDIELISAARSGDADKISDCINRGASVLARDGGGNSPLNIVAGNGSIDCARVILDRLGDRVASSEHGVAIFIAAERGHADCLKLILERGGNKFINSVDGGSNTPLMLAAITGREEIIDILLDQGAAIDLFMSSKMTALMLAAQYGQLACVKRLVARGADIYAADTMGAISMHHAAIFGHARCVSYFLERGADADIHDDTGRTALVMAAESVVMDADADNPYLCCEIMIKAGADIGLAISGTDDEGTRAFLQALSANFKMHSESPGRSHARSLSI